MRIVWASIIASAIAAAACGSGSGGSDQIADVDAGDPDAFTQPSPPLGVDAAPAVCGDGVCAKSETCKACPTDCGECPTCSFAPSCSNGAALPAQAAKVDFDALSTPHAAPLDDAGTPIPNTCSAAQLRLRISRVEVGHQAKEVWLPTGTLNGPPQSTS